MHMPAALVDLAAIRHSSDWLSWCELASEAPPYLSPEFFTLVGSLTDADRVLVAEAWQRERMLGALPLVLAGDTLRALRNDHSPGYDYCGSADGIEAIWSCLRHDHRWNELVLDKVPADSPLVTLLPALAHRDGCPSVIRPDSKHLFLPLAGFEAAMNPKFRTNVQRCARKAGELVLERILVPTAADLDEAFAIEAMGWKGAAGTAIAADPRVAHLYKVIGRLFGRRGRVSLYFLRIAGVRVATLFAVEDGHTLFALKLGYDPQCANLSPGHLIVWKVARDAEQRGLRELDFVGRDAEWKRKWTDKTHDQVSIVVYRRSVRGLTRYGLRELIKPRLPVTVRETPHSPLPRRCQHVDVLGDHTLVTALRGRIGRGLGIRSAARRLFARASGRAPAARPHLGKASRYPEGSWVRVLDETRVRETLDDRGRVRGLSFVPVQWEACGKLYKVSQHVRRIRDDKGRFRPVDRTVLLEGVDCAGHGTAPAGCGRHCPLMFRDEWLQPDQAPHSEPPAANKARHARVRNVEDIYAGLDLFGRRDGVTFMPEMAAFAGKRMPIASELSSVFEHDHWTPPKARIYLLDGAHCSGSLTGSRGPCDRACALLWHADWLVLETEGAK